MPTGSSSNGNGHGHDQVWDDEGPVHDPIGRLVTVLLNEAVKRGCGGIVVDLGGDGCPVHFLRDSEMLEMDSLPLMLYPSLEERLIRLCGGECQNHGTFSTSLKRTETSSAAYCDVQVTVDFADPGLRLTLAVSYNTAQ
jgi:hypothetical protein